MALVVAGIATGEAGGAYQTGAAGYDVSYPQCPSNFPKGGSFAIVGVTNGLPWSSNPCLAGEYAWAATRASAPALYVNTANPGPISTHWSLPGPRACSDPASYGDTGCSYDYGWNAALQAFAVASNAISPPAAATRAWWLDIETTNSWNGTQAANFTAIQGYVDYLNGRGVASIGIYSNSYQWNAITGGHALALPNWIAGAASQGNARRYCGTGFTGGPVALVQFRSRAADEDYAC